MHRNALDGMPARKDIEDVEPVLKVVAFADGQVLEERHIATSVHGRPQEVASGISKSSICGHCEGSFVEPVSESLRSSMRILSCYQIGPQAVAKGIAGEIGVQAAGAAEDTERHSGGQGYDSAGLPIA